MHHQAQLRVAVLLHLLQLIALIMRAAGGGVFHDGEKKKRKQKLSVQGAAVGRKKYQVEKVGSRTAGRVLLVPAILECTRLPLAPAPSGSSFL